MTKVIHKCSKCSKVLNRNRKSGFCFDCSRPSKGYKTSSSFKHGYKPWNKGLKVNVSPRKGIKLSEETKKKISVSKLGKKINSIWTLEARKRASERQKGQKGNNWKGGLTQQHYSIRNSFEYKLWRQAVFKRDSFTCIWCFDSNGGNLEADHIKPFSKFPELRFAIDNGRTLCKKCHKTTDTYGGRLNKK